MPNILLFILLIILILVISFIIINRFGINSSKKIGGAEIVIIPSNIGYFLPSSIEQNIDVKTINYAPRPDGKKLIIGKKSFMNSTVLTELKIPKFIKRIDNESFMGCTLLSSIIFEDRPNSSEYDLSIGAAAFKNCISLTKLNIPNFIDRIDGEAFMGCTSLSSIIFEDSVIQSYNILDDRIILRNAFTNCPSLKNIHNFPPSANFYKNIIFGNTEIDKIIEFTYDNPAIVMRTYLNILNDLISNVLRIKKIDQIENLKAQFLLVEFEKFLSLSNKELYDIIKLHNNIEAIINLITITIGNVSKIKNFNTIYKTTLNEILQFFIKQQNLDILNTLIQEFKNDSDTYLLKIAPELQKDNIDDKISFLIDLFKEIFSNCKTFYDDVILEIPITELLDGLKRDLKSIDELKNVNRKDELYNILKSIYKFFIDQQEAERQEELERQRLRQQEELIEAPVLIGSPRQQELAARIEDASTHIDDYSIEDLYQIDQQATGQKSTGQKSTGPQSELKISQAKQQPQLEPQLEPQELEQQPQREAKLQPQSEQQPQREAKLQPQSEQKPQREAKLQPQSEQKISEAKQQRESKQEIKQREAEQERLQMQEAKQERQQEAEQQRQQQEAGQERRQQKAERQRLQQEAERQRRQQEAERQRLQIQRETQQQKEEQQRLQMQEAEQKTNQQTSIKQQIQEILKQKEERRAREKNGEIVIKKENIYNDDYDTDVVNMSSSAQMGDFIKKHKIVKIEIINPHNNPDEKMELDVFNEKLKKGEYIPRCKIYASNGDIYKHD